MVSMVLQDLLVALEHLDLQEQTEQQDLQDLLVALEHLDLQEQTDKQDLVDLLDLQELQDCLV
jgi:hypothetical protein